MHGPRLIRIREFGKQSLLIILGPLRIAQTCLDLVSQQQRSSRCMPQRVEALDEGAGLEGLAFGVQHAEEFVESGNLFK